MDKKKLQAALKHLPLGGLRYDEQVGSTNDIALAWANEKSIADYSLVLANEQTAGRGRDGRKWQTPADSALALSLILLPNSDEKKNLALFTALGAVALVATLKTNYAINAEIKWPNDVLIEGKKIAGILVEANWLGDQPKAVVLGMGINIRPRAVPPAEMLNFPATSLDDAVGTSTRRLDVLAGLLSQIIAWRPRLGTDKMVSVWDGHLAYKGQQVEVRVRDGQVIHGRVLGINPDGSLRLDTVPSIHFGDVHLRPSRV